MNPHSGFTANYKLVFLVGGAIAAKVTLEGEGLAGSSNLQLFLQSAQSLVKRFF